MTGPFRAHGGGPCGGRHRREGRCRPGRRNAREAGRAAGGPRRRPARDARGKGVPSCSDAADGWLGGEDAASRAWTLTGRELLLGSWVAFRNGALYVAAVSIILRFDDIEARLDDPPTPVIVTDRLPSERHHGWKVLHRLWAHTSRGLVALSKGAKTAAQVSRSR